jgi:hypothetical protein
MDFRDSDSDVDTEASFGDKSPRLMDAKKKKEIP